MGAAVTQRRSGVVAHFGVLAALGALGAVVWMFASGLLGSSAAHAETTSPGGSGLLGGIAGTLSTATDDASGTIAQATGAVAATATDAATSTVTRIPVAGTVVAPVITTVQSAPRTAVTPVTKTLDSDVVSPGVDPLVSTVARAATGLAGGVTPAAAGEPPTTGIASPGPTGLPHLVAPAQPTTAAPGGFRGDLALPTRAFAAAATIIARSGLPAWTSPASDPGTPTFPFPGACAPGASCSSSVAGAGAAGTLSAVAFFAAYRAWRRRGSPDDGLPHAPVYATETSPG